MKEKLSASLKQLNSLRIGGSANIFFPENIQELVDILSTKPIIIGGGSNSLFEDKAYKTPIVCTSLLSSIISIGNKIKVEPGVRLGDLFDFAAGTPATVGGAIYNNFGAFGHQISDFIEFIEIFDLAISEKRIINSNQLDWGYRFSTLQQNKSLILISALFKETRPKKELKTYISKRKSQQFPGFPNAGSIFKNPADDFAGRLIEQCNLKGYAVGDIEVWSGHANILINKGDASFSDYQKIVSVIKATVFEKTGINLEEEVKVLYDQ